MALLSHLTPNNCSLCSTKDLERMKKQWFSNKCKTFKEMSKSFLVGLLQGTSNSSLIVSNLRVCFRVNFQLIIWYLLSSIRQCQWVRGVKIGLRITKGKMTCVMGNHWVEGWSMELEVELEINLTSLIRVVTTEIRCKMGKFRAQELLVKLGTILQIKLLISCLKFLAK